MTRTYGHVEWHPSVSSRDQDKPRPHWLITCEPHVMTKLKRYFAKVKKSEHGSVHLLDNPENARDLLWFCNRYPLAMEPDVEARLRQQAQFHEQRELAVQGILAGEPSKLQFEMALPPREYQRIGADLAVTMGRLLLADDVGIGKTVSAITALAHPGRLPALVVTMTHLPRQWAKEFQRFAPSLRVHILKSGKPYDLGWEIAPPDIIISNYHKLSGWAETLAPLMQSIVLDEVQELRHEGTGKHEAAAHIAQFCSLKMGLSATPIHNYGGEFYSVMSVLDEDALGTQDEFYREWCSGSGPKATIKDPRAFGQYLLDQGLMLRRTRADVGRELPALTVVPHEVEADRRVLEQLGDDVSDLARLILTSDKLEKGAKFRAAGDLDFRLREATGLAKAPFVAEFVKLLVENGEKVVLYGWHHKVYDVWRIILKEFRPAFYTGLQTPNQKDLEIARFQAGDTPIAILSLRSGAGLDGLQHHCRNVVFGELDWSPAVHEQAIGRVYRDGQTDPVVAYFLTSDSGSDPIVSDVLGVKRMQMEGIRDPKAPLVEAGIDPDHMRKLAEDFLRRRGQLTAELAAPPSKQLTIEQAQRWGQARTEQRDLFADGVA